MEVARVNRITIPAHLLLKSEGNVGRVHSVFRQGLNVLTGERFIHIQCERELSSPFSLALSQACSIPFREGVREGDEVVKSDGQLRIGLNEWILYAPEEFYDPCVRPAFGISDSKLGEISKFLIRKIEFFRKKIPPVNFLLETEAIIKSETEGLLGSLTDANLSSNLLREYTGRLIGLGPGLTPMGDDFIIGVMGALARCRTHCNRIEQFFNSLREAIAGHLKQTVAISCEFLHHATRGCFSEKMKNLLYLFSHEKLEEEKLQRSIRSALDFGSTSGMGNLLGIYYGLRICSALYQNGEEGNG